MENENPTGSKKGKLNLLIIAVTAGIMIYLLSQMKDPEAVLTALRTADLRYIGMAFVCMIVFWIMEGVLLEDISRRFGSKLGMRASFRISMIGQVFNNLTPFATGGQPIQAYEMDKYGVTYGESSCILLVKLIIYQIAITATSIVVCIQKYAFFNAHVSGFPVIVIAGFATNMLALSVFVCVGLFPKFTTGLLHGLVNLLAKMRIVKEPQKANDGLDEGLRMFYSNFTYMRSHPTIFVMPVLESLFQQITYFSIPYLIFRAIGVTGVSYWELTCATLFVTMLTSFIPSPGASGGAEGGFYWIFSIFVPNGDLLLMMTVLWRLFTFYLPIIFGSVFYLTRKRFRPNLDKSK